MVDTFELGTTPPVVGDRFRNPRGKTYAVTAVYSGGYCELEGANGYKAGKAFWPLMVSENGWHKLEPLP